MDAEKIMKYHEIITENWKELKKILMDFETDKGFIDHEIKRIAETGGKLKHPYASALAFLNTAELIRLTCRGVEINLVIKYPDGNKRKLILTNQAAEEELI